MQARNWVTMHGYPVITSMGTDNSKRFQKGLCCSYVKTVTLHWPKHINADVSQLSMGLSSPLQVCHCRENNSQTVLDIIPVKTKQKLLSVNCTTCFNCMSQYEYLHFPCEDIKESRNAWPEFHCNSVGPQGHQPTHPSPVGLFSSGSRGCGTSQRLRGARPGRAHQS